MFCEVASPEEKRRSFLFKNNVTSSRLCRPTVPLNWQSLLNSLNKETETNEGQWFAPGQAAGAEPSLKTLASYLLAENLPSPHSSTGHHSQFCGAGEAGCCVVCSGERKVACLSDVP